MTNWTWQNILKKAVPSGICSVLIVLVIYCVAWANPSFMSLEIAKNCAVIGFSIMAYFILFQVCLPLDLYRSLVFFGLLACGAIAFGIDVGCNLHFFDIVIDGMNEWHLTLVLCLSIGTGLLYLAINALFSLKMKKRIQNYYDKSIFPAYRIYSKLSEEYELFYSEKHLFIYEEIYQLEELKLDVKQIEDLVNNNDFKSKKKTIRRKILEKRIRLIEQLADSYEDEELEEILFSILYSLNKDNTIIKIGDIIELIILYSRKNKISVDDDKDFYYLIFYLFIFCFYAKHKRFSAVTELKSEP